MNKVTKVTIAAVMIGLVLAIVYLQFEIQNLQPSQPKETQPTLTPIKQPSSTSTNEPAAKFSPVLSAQPLAYNGFGYPSIVSIQIKQRSSATSLSYNDLKILPGNSYNYIETAPNGTVILSSNSVNNRLINGVYTFYSSINLANPLTSMNSSVPYAIQFIVTHVDGTSISPQDATLVVVVQNSFDPISAEFGGRPTYNYVNLTASVNDNKLTYLCNPRVVENLQDDGGSIITSGFDKTLQMTTSFATTGTYNLSVDMVPLT